MILQLHLPLSDYLEKLLSMSQSFSACQPHISDLVVVDMPSPLAQAYLVPNTVLALDQQEKEMVLLPASQ